MPQPYAVGSFEAAPNSRMEKRLAMRKRGELFATRGLISLGHATRDPGIKAIVHASS